jgi:ribonucleoside-diphosphate reductase alpha chain
VRDLKKRGLWDEEMLEDLKYFDGSVQEIERVPEDLKKLYLTAFEIDSGWLIDCASRRQKWLDMGQSLNLYLARPSGRELSEMYLNAWRKGLKTTYYLRSRGATGVEKSSMDINKRGIQPRWMKSVSASSRVKVEEPVRGETCSVDDIECEACQ